MPEIFSSVGDVVALVRPDPPVPLAHVTRWPVVVDAYLAAAIDSDHTRRTYHRHLYTAFSTLGTTTVTEVTGAALADYRARLTSSPLSPASHGQALTALHAFLTWSRSMGAHQLPAEVVATALRTPRSTVRRPYSVLADPEVSAIIAAAVDARDKALLAVMLGAGLRVAEVCALDVSDILTDQDGETALFVRQGKGRKDRTVRLKADVARYARTFLAPTKRRLGGDGPLFRAHDRAAGKLVPRRLSTRAVGDVVNRCTIAAGIDAKHVSPHALRAATVSDAPPVDRPPGAVSASESLPSSWPSPLHASVITTRSRTPRVHKKRYHTIPCYTARP